MTLLFALACETAPAPAPEEHHAPDEVVLAPEARAAARLEVAPATVGRLDTAVQLPARIALDPRKEALLSAWIAGQVDQIKVQSGDSVRQGAALGTVQSPELGEAVGAFRSAAARHRASEARLERLRRLEAAGVSSRAQLLEAEADLAESAGAREAAEERLRVMGLDASAAELADGDHYPSRVPVRTPVAGEVLRVQASVGQAVVPGDPLFHVGDLDEVWLLVDVYERDLPRVAVGQPLTFTVEAWAGEPFTGIVAQVGDWIDPAARSVEVRAVVPNPDHRLKPNMFATATLRTTDLAEQGPEAGPEGVVLPIDALATVGGREVVFVERQPNVFAAVPVAVAERSGVGVVLSGGVEPGAPVVVVGAFTLASELQKPDPEDGHAH